MRVRILQHDIVWGDPEANRRQLEEQIDAHPNADLYVLPEMWPTGFVTDPEDVAEPATGPSFNWMAETAQRHNAAIAGSLAVREDGRYYNRFYFVSPDGWWCHYDKRHLFGYGGEDKHYTPGDRRMVVEWRGVRFLLAVCYDLRFPVWTRNHKAYDAILYVANWPTARIEAWNTLLRARAIENQCYVVGVNRVGSDPNCTYCGCSAIIDAYGRTIAECDKDKVMSVEACLDMDALEAFRRKFPVLDDTDRLKIEN